MKLYLPPSSPPLPEQIRLGPSTLTLNMTGSHLSPQVKVSFKGASNPDDAPNSSSSTSNSTSSTRNPTSQADSHPVHPPTPTTPSSMGLTQQVMGSRSGLDYSGFVLFSQRKIEGSLDHGPSLRLRGEVAIDVPFLDRARRAEAQGEATYYSKPRFQGCDVEGSLGPLDLMPIVSQGQGGFPFEQGER